MSEIRKWLKTIGLGQYADSFEANDIDMDLLAQVEDQLLKDIGISSAGHRLRIRNAITKLGAHVQSETADGPLMSAGAAFAERRQVTVMFSDLVGSTALSTRMDPEDLRQVISAYQKCVADTVGHFGGFVAKYMGDGVLIYFGYPQAHEDDAERAVRAGLELMAAVRRLKTHAPLHTRVGIATGLVVVGDLIGSGASREQAIVGETPNLAARLQGVAEPNTVVNEIRAKLRKRSPKTARLLSSTKILHCLTNIWLKVFGYSQNTTRRSPNSGKPPSSTQKRRGLTVHSVMCCSLSAKPTRLWNNFDLPSASFVRNFRKTPTTHRSGPTPPTA